MSILNKVAKASIGLGLLAVYTVSGQDALTRAGRTGPNSGLNSQVLNYT